MIHLVREWSHGPILLARYLERLKTHLQNMEINLEESIKDIKETVEEVNGGLTDGLESMKEQLRNYMLESLDSIENKLMGKGYVLEVMRMTLKENIAELNGELTIYKAILCNEMHATGPKPNVDVSKSKKFKGTRSTDEKHGEATIGTWEQFTKEFKAQFYSEYAKDEALAKLLRLTQQGTVRGYV
ncbi:hypothetical protein PVK06_024815 [Gossypium arboreum]|uniref:Retrotransposon gag domain-containing protein n=1 Tax=Gossypium arboreum TaxID=29729 RepID=A0ABR0PF64_GOSAR|nr:hypothetical protein PVK06_024815 [Gossypium arboreum]